MLLSFAVLSTFRNRVINFNPWLFDTFWLSLGYELATMRNGAFGEELAEIRFSNYAAMFFRYTRFIVYTLSASNIVYIF